MFFNRGMSRLPVRQLSNNVLKGLSEKSRHRVGYQQKVRAPRDSCGKAGRRDPARL
ncbi:putative uncharacterized protein [Bacillus sp. OxB-1]|nr:putative uncharacterized protein [Bacillus sp. OxB-1]